MTGFKGDIQTKQDPIEETRSFPHSVFSRWQHSLKKMDESDAFSIDEEALRHNRELDRLLALDRHKNLVKVAVAVVAFLVLFFFSQCIVVSGFGFISPAEMVSCLKLGLQMTFGNITHSAVPLSPTEVMALQPNYYEVTTRLAISILTSVCGALLAVSGMLFQNTFRNPIAAPTMLGVSSGVSLGVLVLVLVFGSTAANRTGSRYLLCFLGVVLVLSVVFLGSRLIDKKRRQFNVVNMMLIGSLVSQLIGCVVSFVSYWYLSDELYEVFYEVQERLNADVTLSSFLMIGIVAVVSLCPVLLVRFSLNALSFSEDDSRSFGLNLNLLRFISLAAGSLMICASMLYCGMVSMASLLVPHISRFLYGAEFRRQLVGNIVLGSFLLLLCRDVCGLIPFLDTGIPLGTAISLITLPAFVWMLALQQRSWE